MSIVIKRQGKTLIWFSSLGRYLTERQYLKLVRSIGKRRLGGK